MFFENKKICIEFGKKGGGFPTRIALKYPHENIVFLESNEPFLQIGTADGRILRPVCGADDEPFTQRQGDCCRIQFDRLQFSDQSGKTEKDFFMTVRYEIYDDGTTFVQTHFIAERFPDPVALNMFKLTVPLNFDQYENIHTPFGMDAGLSSSIASTDGNIQRYQGIKPSCNWNCKTAAGCGGYFELFMEDAPALDQGLENRSTEIIADGMKREVSWNFQTKEASMYHRNVWESLLQWGWIFTAPPAERRNPPFRMYHWIDAFEDRIPSDRQLELMHRAGTDMIILHEVWRSDVSGIAFPYDRKRLEHFISKAHELNIRIVLYIRGVDELSTVEDCCDWFSTFLKKDFDGLYADFGGALNVAKPPCKFKRHYLVYRKIRETIGKYGLFFAHSGALSSAVGLTAELIDGYTSGEGEMGSLSKSRFMHESLSGAYVTTGSFWTAAFPHYGSAHMIPFMALTGQYPHTPLGIQHQSSSLAHPKVPGLNDVYLRPLWKFYELMNDTCDLKIFNDYNGNRAVENLPPQCGHYMLYDAEKSKTLLILGNFSDTEQNFDFRIDWQKLGITTNDSFYIMRPDENSPGIPEKMQTADHFKGILPAKSCIAFFSGQPNTIIQYCKNYPELSAEGTQHLQFVEKQLALREAHNDKNKKLYCKILLPIAQTPCICMTAFYQTEHEIGYLDGDGIFHKKGYITKNGIQQQKPVEDEWLWAGDTSPWLELNNLFSQQGDIQVAVKSFCLGVGGCYFHSFVEVLLAEEPSEEAAEKIVFVNEIEPDRSALTFKIRLK